VPRLSIETVWFEHKTPVIPKGGAMALLPSNEDRSLLTLILVLGVVYLVGSMIDGAVWYGMVFEYGRLACTSFGALCWMRDESRPISKTRDAPKDPKICWRHKGLKERLHTRWKATFDYVVISEAFEVSEGSLEE